MLLYGEWQKEHKELIEQTRMAAASKKAVPTEILEIPETEKESAKTKPGSETDSQSVTAASMSGEEIIVKTDVLDLSIDTLGGDIVRLDLPAYPEGEKGEAHKRPFVLFDRSPQRYYIAQSGLTGKDGPDSRETGRAKYSTDKNLYQLADNENRLVVDLVTKAGQTDVTKRYIFHRGEYVVELEYLIDNQGTKDYQGSLYGQLKRKPDSNEGSGFLGIQTYTGAAVHTKNTPYKKITFKDIAEKPFSETVNGGWAAMVEHYFVSAWIPASGIEYSYQTTELPDGSVSIGFKGPLVTVQPGKQDSLEAKLYAGPEITENLKQLAPGLELSVDYGILWPICQPIFWVLKKINEFVGNWGLSIILITVLIKLLFYKLSAASYRSMGNMRKLQPRIEALKERFGEDKQKFSQAVMELYRKEKINPLGGCLPILVQIPVFISLYYVLLGSVELRQAPFIFWIHDLSAKDPYYVLPVLMGLSMLVQQKLNPPPPDPMQAKVMMLMPVIFTVLFLNFPSGLVLYWFVNNLLSIIQQWYITRKVANNNPSEASTA